MEHVYEALPMKDRFLHASAPELSNRRAWPELHHMDGDGLEHCIRCSSGEALTGALKAMRVSVDKSLMLIIFKEICSRPKHINLTVSLWGITREYVLHVDVLSTVFRHGGVRTWKKLRSIFAITAADLLNSFAAFYFQWNINHGTNCLRNSDHISAIIDTFAFTADEIMALIRMDMSQGHCFDKTTCAYFSRRGVRPGGISYKNFEQIKKVLYGDNADAIILLKDFYGYTSDDIREAISEVRSPNDYYPHFRRGRIVSLELKKVFGILPTE